MIKLISVNGWDLKNHAEYVDEKDIVVLWAKFHEEKMGLNFDILNLLPPENKIFWGLDTYQSMMAGENEFVKEFVNERVRDSLQDVVGYYWGGDSLGAYVSMRAIMKEFGETFGSLEGNSKGRNLMSVVMPVNMINNFIDYFQMLLFYLKEDSLILHEENEQCGTDVIFLKKALYGGWKDMKEGELFDLLDRKLTSHEKNKCCK